MPICPVCNEHNRDKNIFCINCGEELIHLDFVKSPESPPRKKSPRIAPSIKAMAPVSVSAPAPQVTQPPSSTAPEPFSDNAMPEPIPTEPAPPPYEGSVPPYSSPFPKSENAAPFPDDIPVSNGAPAPFPDSADDTNKASFPDNTERTYTPVEDSRFPQNEVSEAPETAAEGGDVPFPDDDPQTNPKEAALPFPEDEDPEAAPISSSAALPFPEDEPNTSEAAPVNTAIPFPEDDDTPQTTDAKAEDRIPFPEEEEDGTPTSAATGAPFPDEDEPPFPANRDSAKPKKIPGKPVTGTQIHQAISVSAPPRRSSPPQLDQIANGGAHRAKPQTSDALPRPKTPKTTLPAPVQWHRECEMCGFHNEPDAVYCGECGTAIKKTIFSESAMAQRAKLVQVSFDGGETQVFDIDTQGLAIHTETGEIEPLDRYHPDTHALFRIAGGDIQLTPSKGEHGVYVRIPPKKPTEIDTGSVIRLGHQTLLFEGGAHQYNAWGTLTATPPSSPPQVIPLDTEDMIIGREAGHIQFTDDFLVSGTHMRIYTANGRYLIYDLASTNGTYLQVATPYHPVPGEVFIISAKIYKTTIEGT